MALYGVLGDIHGNREALIAVLGFLEGCGADRLACVGDIVGYNADPDECVALLRERGALAIAGNHDLISVGRLGFERTGMKAGHALRRTRRELSSESVNYLAALPDSLALDERSLMVHGGVRDVEKYMVSAGHIGENARYLRADHPGIEVCFYGHTHEPKVYEVHGEEVRELPAAGCVGLRDDCLYFINAGSVDASRRRVHKFAECALYDSEAHAVEFFRVAYADSVTEGKAAAYGYRMDPWAERLQRLRRRFAPAVRKAMGK